MIVIIFPDLYYNYYKGDMNSKMNETRIVNYIETKLNLIIENHAKYLYI